MTYFSSALVSSIISSCLSSLSITEIVFLNVFFPSVCSFALASSSYWTFFLRTLSDASIGVFMVETSFNFLCNMCLSLFIVKNSECACSYSAHVFFFSNMPIVSICFSLSLYLVISLPRSEFVK